MQAELLSSLRAECLAELPSIRDNFLGIKACGGADDRFGNTHFGRDAYISIIQALSEHQNGELPFLLQSAIRTQRLAASLQGKYFNSLTEEAPGKKPHEHHNGYSDQVRLAAMEKQGWPVYEENGRLKMLYYGAGDSTPLFNISVAVVYRAIASKDQNAAKVYLEEMWPYVQAGLYHDIHFGDLDNDGLIESDPHNRKALLNHTWKDSNDAYRDENGTIPKPPYKYLTNNSYFLWSLREGMELSEVMGEPEDATEELAKSYARGRDKLHHLFWMPDEGYYAPLIDGNGDQVRFISDDPIIALWAQVIDPEFAHMVIARLKQSDMNTKWGLRTRSSLSSQFRVNGPKAYHNGTIWLHQLLIAAKAVECYGEVEFAEVLDNEAFAYQRRMGRAELVAVDRKNCLFDYQEKGVSVACKPQTWGTYGTLGRTAKAVIFTS